MEPGGDAWAQASSLDQVLPPGDQTQGNKKGPGEVRLPALQLAPWRGTNLRLPRE
jgi:hypothetical protein